MTTSPYKTCTKNKECPDKYCGHPGVKTELVCCPDGSYDWDPFEKNYCKNLPGGSPCRSKDGCANKACAYPGSIKDHKICCPSGNMYYDKTVHAQLCQGTNVPLTPLTAPNLFLPLIISCKSDAGCSSNNCVKGKCSPHKKLSLRDKVIVIIPIFGIIIIIVFILFLIRGKNNSKNKNINK